MIAATKHDRYVKTDYKRLQEQGIYTARDGLRWHLIEPTPGRYDFSSLLPMVRAARETGMQIIRDLCHYGWPDDIDIFTPEFIRRVARFARASIRVLLDESDILPMIVPVNEISFWSWAGGDVAYFNPFAQDRGQELKEQLVRAAVEAIEAIWSINPHIRMVHVEPAVHVIAAPDRPGDRQAAEEYCLSQYEAWDMLSGRRQPHLGGHEKYLDIVGVNYYPYNQWFVHNREMIPWGHPLYRPLHQILGEVYERYGRPMFISETGTENDIRPAWLRYVGSEVQASLQADVPIEGICLYPILNHPGWLDERHCCNGLWDYANEAGEREIYQPLAQELHRQEKIIRLIKPLNKRELVAIR